MKRIASLFLLCLAGNVHAGGSQVDKRPNILLFLVDDMGWQDTSVPFWNQKTPLNERYETPNMERLARKGVKFTQAYANSISSPSRVSLFTGMNSACHRVTNWTLERNASNDAPSDKLIYPQWNVNGFCQQDKIEYCTYATSLAQVLKDNGYYTIHCGKAHFAARSTPGANPLNMGFDVNIAGGAPGAPGTYQGLTHFGNAYEGHAPSRFATPGLEEYRGKDIFLTEALTLEAVKALDKVKQENKPFFLYMAHYAVHVPLEKDKRFYEKYKKKGLSDNDAAYAGLVEGMDKSLGDLMDYLEKNNLMDNTIILFMSDNGGLASEPYWHTPLYVQNAPLSSGKGSAHEGGIREPMIVYWPGVTRPQSECDKYVIIEDFFPTILEMAKIKRYHTVQHVDGVSFIPLLTGKKDTSKNRALFWNFPNGWGEEGPGFGASCTIRKGDWKLIYYYGSQKKELFNIANDISEKQNLAQSHPDIVKRLSDELGQYLRKNKSQRPRLKSTGELIPWPDEVQ